ncbi:MAG TPA: pseudouridine synthase [Mariprofundaceae bacterium]|nr:pseudouridine synthase [Mariprofundaceae bacterium]
MQKPRQPKAATKSTTTKPKPDKAKAPTSAAGSERINRYLARCGLCSRREADRWIAAGRISINDNRITEPGVQIGPKDVVAVDGKPVSRVESFTYILYHKPRGLLCARHDPKGRPLIYDKLDVAANVQNVGRLDMDTEGLLLLTDDGDLTRALTNPRNELPREYRVRVGGRLELETLEKLRHGGLDIGKGEKSAPWEVSVDSETGGHTWLTVIIKRGRWREVRRTLEAAGHPVRRLIRTRFGSLKLEPDMPVGSWIRLNAAEVRRLKASVAGR